MAEIHPSLHIDDDWKKQAQEEKRKLAEAEAAKKAQAAADTAVTSTTVAGGIGATAGKSRRNEVPPASFATLVQTLMTQALFYLGELGSRNGQTMVDLDLARSHVDLLGVLETKCKGNLTADEQQLIDSALYETRMRFVAVAREYVDLSSPR